MSISFVICVLRARFRHPTCQNVAEPPNPDQFNVRGPIYVNCEKNDFLL